MGKKVLVFLFILGLVFSLPGIWNRYTAERFNNGVDLVMDYNSLQTIIREEQQPKLVVLRRLKASGLTSIALYPDGLKDLINRGQARLFSGNEVMRSWDQTDSLDPLFAVFPFENDSVFIKIKEADLIKRTLAFLPDWAGKYGLEYIADDAQLVIFFKKWDVKFLHLSLGLDDQLAQEIQSLGLKIVPRINNIKANNLLNWSILQEYRPEYVIFAGAEVTGYDRNPARRTISTTAQIMREHNILYGMIESHIAYQKGAATLARELNYDLLRVHSIQQAEMDSPRDKYLLEGIVDRYLRAVRERNVRLLYLKPFLKQKQGLPPLELTEKYIQLLTGRLRDEGYLPGKLSPFKKYGNSRLDLVMISLAITAAGLLLLSYLLDNGLREWLLKYYWLPIIIILLVELGLLFTGRVFLLRKLLALASSVIFPSLAIISQLLAGRGKGWLTGFVKATLISLSGVVLLVGSLAHISFSLKVDQFSGVKFSFLLPLIIISLYYLKILLAGKDYNWLERARGFLNLNIKVKHLLMIATIALFAAIYVGRTGNYPSLPVPDFEIFFRNWLEKILYVRPRFKEFLIGHPLMIIGLKLVDRLQGKLIFYPILFLASIGQINILNTFSHIHTPLLVSSIRVIHGLWLGILIALLLWIVPGLIANRWLRKQAG